MSTCPSIESCYGGPGLVAASTSQIALGTDPLNSYRDSVRARERHGRMPSKAGAEIVYAHGDVNCDSFTNVRDAALVLQFEAALVETLPCRILADVSGDGEVGSADASLILEFEAGFLRSLPPAVTLVGTTQPGVEGCLLLDTGEENLWLLVAVQDRPPRGSRVEVLGYRVYGSGLCPGRAIKALRITVLDVPEESGA